MKIRKREWSLVLSALALVVAGACSTVKSATGMEGQVAQPNIRAERLQGIPDSQLGEVKSEQQKLEQARQAWDQSKKDTENLASRIDYAKSNLDLAKAEVKSAKERGQVSTKEVPGGAEQRAAQEEPSMSDLHAAELKQESAKARVDYLEKLHNYAELREDVAKDLVDVAQARVDSASYKALARARPEEARALKMNDMDYRKAVTDRETKVEKARAELEKARSKAMASYDVWKQHSQNLRPEDRGEDPPAPDSLPIL